MVYTSHLHTYLPQPPHLNNPLPSALPPFPLNTNPPLPSHSWTAVRVTARTCGKHRELDGCLAAADEGEEEGDWWVDGGEDELVRVGGEEVGRASGLERGRRVVGGGGDGGDGLERARRRGK